MQKTVKIPRGVLVNAMISTLIKRGYHDPNELFDLIHDLHPRHGLHDYEIRDVIQHLKSR